MNLQHLSFDVRVARKVHQIAPSWQQLALVLSDVFSGRYYLLCTSRWMCLSNLSTSLKCITFMVACSLSFPFSQALGSLFWRGAVDLFDFCDGHCCLWSSHS